MESVGVKGANYSPSHPTFAFGHPLSSRSVIPDGSNRESISSSWPSPHVLGGHLSTPIYLRHVRHSLWASFSKHTQFPKVRGGEGENCVAPWTNILISSPNDVVSSCFERLDGTTPESCIETEFQEGG